ncbi:unnamed protein product [Caenorhabditis nigoni]|uniref:F-box associated domain-containing protein n=1 Tax=Caenorhabditis nigoni TaxID=1611254 RepID=A0A2G5V7M2_9PELO|nr:hypothetical protein B9Z55_007004 [Caenorhabditis nigoni]
MPVVSYPVLCCILEHIEADCRLILSARCPKVSKMEKAIPLRVHDIMFKENIVEIGHTTYKITSKKPKSDASEKYDKTPKQSLTLQLYNSISEFTAEKTFSRNYRVEVATRKVVEYLLGGRNDIYVRRLIVSRNGYKNIQYLFGISNMKVSELRNYEINLPNFHPLIEGPLKELKFHVSHPTDFENPIARTAEKIVILSYGYNEPDIWLETYQNLPNKEVMIVPINHDLTDTDILELIEYWRGTRKTVGSSFSLRKENAHLMEMFLENIKERFQGTYVKLRRTGTIVVTETNAVSIKIDSESSIVIYRVWYDTVVIKVMAVGSSTETSKTV